MANEYYVLDENQELGSASMRLEAFNDIALVACSKVEGIFAAKKENEMCVASLKDNELTIDVYIKLLQGVDVASACTQIQNEVYNSILQMTGIKTKAVDVNIAGFVSEKE